MKRPIYASPAGPLKDTIDAAIADVVIPPKAIPTATAAPATLFK
jgi:hypothetical protein